MKLYFCEYNFFFTAAVEAVYSAAVFQQGNRGEGVSQRKIKLKFDFMTTEVTGFILEDSSNSISKAFL